ncbi:hypothetical protein BDN70DRAFT_929792 [Pholiota conissans]|uniref:HNH nuclease domain-containing protein n=1 Tax=Pholiota conissans TaxID=109636 RepID=A0A9P5ZA03_9AGAR|nr:hypothetical protein BDN70DRAFT_929792 [Pholiota conissans]
MESEPYIWSNFKARGWIPSQVKLKANPSHEPRDGLLMCANHHLLFDGYAFFIRFLPDKFVLVNFSNDPDLRQFHGKAIALDIRGRHGPFASLSIIHEMRVREFHPFDPVEPAMSTDYPWQDWILSDGNEDNGNNISAQSLPQFQPTRMNTGDTSGGHRLALNADVVADILAAIREMSSWKACKIEGTSWAGTAEENIGKYISSIGIPDH